MENVSLRLVEPQLLSFLKEARLKTDRLSYSEAVRHAIERARASGQIPTPTKNGARRFTVRFDPETLPGGSTGTMSDRVKAVLWLSMVLDTRAELERLLSDFIGSEELPAVLEQIDEIVSPLTGYEFFPEEKVKAME